MAGSATSITVIPLHSGDLVAVAQCIAIDAEAFPYASTQFGLRAAVTAVWIAREGGSSGGRGRVLGFAAARARSGDVDIEGLAVARDARRRGIGRALLDAVIDRARRDHCATVSLHVWANNQSAIQMYRTHGFIVWRRLAGYYRSGTFDATGDAYEMMLHLGR